MAAASPPPRTNPLFSFLFLFFSLFFYSALLHCSALSTVSISETSNQTLVCAIVYRSDTQQSSLNCSSLNGNGVAGIPIFPAVAFSGVVSGDGFVAAVRTFTSPVPTSTLVTWRFSGGVVERKRIYSGPEITELESGNSNICGLIGSGGNGSSADSSVRDFDCWQWREFNASSVPRFSSIAVGEDFVCGISSLNGNITCIGDNRNSISSRDVISQSPPGENYRAIAAGFRHACALRSDGRLTCWGEETNASSSSILEGERFISMAVGENRTCGLRSNDTVICWGQNDFRLPASLEGTHFVSIEAKRTVFCGVVREDFSLHCWGGNFSNQSSNSSSIVFSRVLPSACRIDSQCRCGPLTGSGNLCQPGYSICQLCRDIADPPPPPPPQPPTLQPQSPPPPVNPSSSSGGGGGWNSKMTAFTTVGSAGSLAILLVIGFFLYKRVKCSSCKVHDSGPIDEPTSTPPPQRNPSLPRVLEKRLSELASMGNAGKLEEYSLEILLEATSNFSDDHKIGTGSFGSVYRATFPDGREVAVKRAENSSGASPRTSLGICIKHQEDKDNAFVHELESLSRLHHKNLVRLLGFCEDGSERILVYEYASNGSLHDHLHRLDESPLTTWPARIKVALDAARGIEYLHVYSVPPIIHRDIKSSNILLDASWIAKVSDFGLSLMGPSDDETHLSMRAAGTVGYMDPEYYRLQQLTTKSDVYSLGIVLLEMLSGCKAIHKNENGVPRNVVDFVVPYIVHDEIHRVLDPRLPPPTPFEIEAVAYVGYLAADCVMLEGRDRPSMTDIVNSLERALAACLVHSSSLSRSTTSSSI